jgi:transposase
VRYLEHGVVVAAVPWARHGAGYTRSFEDAAAWLVTRTSKSAVVQLLRVAWRSVGRIVTRVSAEASAAQDRFAGLRRLGVDEISYKRGHCCSALLARPFRAERTVARGLASALGSADPFARAARSFQSRIRRCVRVRALSHSAPRCG